MKNKLKLILWGKNLELPIDYDNLEFDRYELKYNNKYELYFYKNNKMIKLIMWWYNGNKYDESNYKNGEKDGKQYMWYEDGKLFYEFNYKNDKENGKQYIWDENGKLKHEVDYKNGKLI